MPYLEPLPNQRKVHLSEFPTRAPEGLDRDEAEARTEELGNELADLEDLLYAAGSHGLLIVLQGMDTAGKDGLIRCIFRYTNAQSTRVSPFKVPTVTEMAHDFLWRVHAVAPGKGGVGIFNRSHYEDVLVPVVNGTLDKKARKKRYVHINNFEDLLADQDIIITKFFLHISKEEQRERLVDRESDPEKAWKLSVGDWQVREKWDDYQKAYQKAIRHTNIPRAPWKLVPADQKWFRNLAVIESLVESLRPFKQQWLDSLAAIGQTELAALKAYREAKNL